MTISLLVKRKGQKGCKIFYARRPEFDTADDKLSFLANTSLPKLAFERIEANPRAVWLDQTDNDWDTFIALASKAAKANKTGAKGQAIFRLFSSGLKTQRDEWVYDLSTDVVEAKMRYFIEVYDATRKNVGFEARDTIKWDATLDAHLSRRLSLAFDANSLSQTEFRPFVKRWVYFHKHLNGRTYQLPQMFAAHSNNRIISFLGIASSNTLAVFASDKLFDLGQLKNGNGGTQGVSRHRYTASGERVDNITDWALREFHKAYGKDGRGASAERVISPLEGEMPGRAEGGEDGAQTPPSGLPPISPSRGEISRQDRRALTKDDIFHYVYGVLHDPVYREKYALNLKREFPRIPFYQDFWQWADWGERLMALHIGYEKVEPWPLERLDTPDTRARDAGVQPKALLKADRDNGIIRLDTETQLSGIPREAWEYRLGNRSGLDWILDQYKEKTPKDPTIREKFNTYRFADYKERVIDLLMRVTRVSVETVAITEAMKATKR